MSNASLSRRAFVSGSVLGAAAVGTGVALAQGIGATAAQADEQGDELGANVAPIEPVGAPDVWDVETDVIVIGTGSAGGAAAVAAAEEGAHVVVLEWGNTWGGNSQFATGVAAHPDMGPGALYSWGIGSTDMWMNSAIAKMVGDNIYDDLDWLLDLGKDYMKYVLDRDADGYVAGSAIIPWPADYEEPENPTFMQEGWYQWFPHNASGFTSTLRMAAEKLGVDIRYGARVTALVVEGDSVTGVQATLDDGSALYVKAPQTVLASGGYIANYDMLKQYMSPGTYPFVSKYAGTPLSQGDGIRMAQGLGAKVTDLECVNIECGGVYDPENMGLHSAANVTHRRPALSVNILGKRYADESTGNWEVKAMMKNSQPRATTFTIVDSTMIDPMDIWEKFTPVACEVPTSTYQTTFDDQLERGIIVKADTIEELAGLLGLDAATLKETVDRYNGFCEKGVDEDFLKPAELLYPISTPPFYGVKGRGGTLTCTIGGICYDEYLRVIDEDGMPIQGIFCCGEVAHALYCQHNAIPSGRYAGRMAARSALGEQKLPVPVAPLAAQTEGVTVDTWAEKRATPTIPADGCNSCHGVEDFRGRTDEHESYAGDSCMSCHEEDLTISMERPAIPVVPHHVAE